jgi:hypothetical protein
MQIIAKAGLVSSGIYAVVNLSWYLTHVIPSFNLLIGILCFAVFAVFIAVITFFLIFNNDSLARKMAGPGEKLNPAANTLWLSSSLRVAAVFCGLILLSASVPTIRNILLVPIRIRPFINEIFLFDRCPRQLLMSFSEWCEIIYNFLKLILVVYLLCGAPHFVRWQLRHITIRYQPVTQKIEPENSPLTNSERLDNE